MYIKRVVIRGFKTYKNETVIEDISPHHNVVVGRNGSGKSNFFAAIRFVLSDAYTNLSREERQSLIHESSVNIMSAYVEIVFDNTDRRIPIAKDEVAIRRTIGMKKDDYSLDYKSATRSEIVNILESSGFSRSNPYYIVPQGKVTALTNAKDSERLDLLKDIAGARVFEHKLKESLKEMAITAEKQEQIKDMVSDIEKRLQELNIEKEDLKAFEILTNKKKILEFNIYDRELKALNNQLDALENNQSLSAQETESFTSELESREAQILRLEAQLEDFKSKKQLFNIDLEMNTKETGDILQQITNLNIQLQEARNGNSNIRLESYNERISEIENEIALTTEELNESKEILRKLKLEESKLKLEMNNLRQKQLSIISKKNQSKKFNTKTERDAYIQNKIKQLDDSKIKRSHDLRNLEKHLKVSQTLLQEALAEKARIKVDESLSSTIDELNHEISSLKSEARALVDDRSLLWRKESKINSVIALKEENLMTVEQSLRGGINASTLNALDTVKDIAKKLGPSIENGIYGYLGELIDVSEKYKTAVDVIGGNSLFNIVVNNDQTASILIEELRKVKRSRTTFIPLNRLSNESFVFPSGTDFVPLIKKIAYDDFLAPAVKQIFGKTVVCVDIQRGFELSNEYNVNAVTIDGDRCDNRGVLTGGFRDIKVSRIDYLKNLRVLKNEIYKSKQELKVLKEEINGKDFAINANHQKSMKLKSLLDIKTKEASDVESLLSRFNNKIAQHSQDIAFIEQKIEACKASIDSIEKQISNYTDEIESVFSQNTFTEHDETTLKEIYSELPLLEKKHRQVMSEIEAVDLKISSASTLISEILNPRYNNLKYEIEAQSSSEKDSDNLIRDLESSINKLKLRQSELKNEGDIITSNLLEINKSIQEDEERLAELNAEQEKFIKRFEDMGKSTDKTLSQRVRLRNRKHGLERSIGELGIIPEDALVAFEDESTSGLSKKLTKINESLKKYYHVNKKAMEQFAKFSREKDSLVDRLLELDEAKDAIENLIKVLQHRKNEAIIRAFKEVSSSFSKTFEALVPTGKGRLVILKKSKEQVENPLSLSQYPDSNGQDGENSDLEDSAAEESESANDLIDSYVGISISVSFNSKKDEQQQLEQLSGGQKTVCALSLILAIQSCDPAPFYLFDEIDSNLDAQYRTAVANLVHKLSKNAQFICTTFRSEMLKVSDKFYGVMFNNKVSTISSIDSEQALDFVEDQKQ